MSKLEMVMLSLLAAAMLTALVAMTRLIRTTRYPRMPADGSAPALPAPIEVYFA